jgi:hypothetical protein
MEVVKLDVNARGLDAPLDDQSGQKTRHRPRQTGEEARESLVLATFLLDPAFHWTVEGFSAVECEVVGFRHGAFRWGGDAFTPGWRLAANHLELSLADARVALEPSVSLKRQSGTGDPDHDVP